MAKLLLGKEVNEALARQLAQRAEKLRERGISPKLAIIRCGEKPSEITYERGVSKKAASAGVETENIILPELVSADEIKSAIIAVNADESVHGCLILSPLPSQLLPFQDEIFNTLSPRKDIDCLTRASTAALYLGSGEGFCPCTAEACMEIFRHYDIPLGGRNVTVIGRSQVVGKPTALMLTAADATVTLCHSKTLNVAEHTRSADIIISCAGALGSLTKAHVRPGQTVIDVSMNWDSEKPGANGQKGGMAGDALFDEVEPIVDAITPVPGGVGAVTSMMLIKHTIEAAEKI